MSTPTATTLRVYQPWGMTAYSISNPVSALQVCGKALS